MIQLQTLGLLLLCHVLTAENKTYDRGGGGGGGGEGGTYVSYNCCAQ